ncbi:MAG: DNA-binding response regulator [Chloroflexi bacterium HGW-Chloroflexi-10]|nr:MAG: DNA-binding response regulator [Chloroflexi bacterium HGW-Chloroflexi-10]
MRVLIVDDEKRIVEGVRKYFEQAGFDVSAVYDGDSALKSAIKDQPDLIVLDWMLPGMSGLDVCREIRRESNVPIIMLTARVEETDKLIGLELGADDYVTKPFSPRELVARARAVLRRTQVEPAKTQMVYEFGQVALDTKARECRLNDVPISLTPTEYDLLLYLVCHPNQVCSRSKLLSATDLGAYEGMERTVDVHIHNLRKKIEPDPAVPRFILTVFGVGYRFVFSEG